ncbi:MAG: hypothetical protein EOP48_24835 [Sphingobacteriales bacterium]|nr:MAG: hypothetical protein EOP48_24835 [Sphingobacteriales bacterium]
MDLEGNKKAARDLRDLFEGKKVFDYPKPIELLKRIIQISTEKDSLIVDFFSGSATMAHSLLEYNIEHKDSARRYILIQLPEECKKESEAYTYFGFRTLDEIGQERIRRAGTKLKKEHPDAKVDYGFKRYTLIEPPANTIDKIEQFDATALFADENILEQFGKESVLETWLVKDGYGFGANIKEVKLNRYTAYYIAKHLYFIDAGITENDIVSLIDMYNKEPQFGPENIVIFGYSFTFSQTEMLRKNLAVLKDGHKNLRTNLDIRY